MRTGIGGYCPAGHSPFWFWARWTFANNFAMDFNFSLGASVQAIDQIGHWEPAVITSFVNGGYRVAFEGWGPEWDLTRSPSSIRPPTKKRKRKWLFTLYWSVLLFSFSYRFWGIKRRILIQIFLFSDSIWNGAAPFLTTRSVLLFLCFILISDCDLHIADCCL